MDLFAKPIGALVHLLYNVVKVFDSPYLSGYAIAIIVATIILKFVLLPLTLKQTKSMKKMQEIQPKIKEIQKKYKNDPQTAQMKTMELYKEHNVNPFGGCFPLLIQMPIIMGFFYVLREPVKYIFSNQEQVYANINKSFLWIKDLGFPANYVGTGVESGVGLPEGVINGLSLGFNIPWIGSALPILAIIAGLTTYLSTKTMNTTTQVNDKAQSQQNTMTMIMPIMIFFFALNFPAGLTLYWVVSNIFQLVQQYLTNRAVYKVKEESN
ncbi:YidC/Oxa1 family membrane protein insertase [Caldisalinibacter kiritimatiensis]|uniref:Inner membrane protein translocase component YidC, short form n=1 Tax=Caldisalinibacter kiritimatiensis TaxID=1304284 RepID=R1CAT8_9FIRM|nr:YidC/Oxa1 family membrane protein insertase [Caldisalinibacter kiritimatiensis]EOC99429.1 Inner membrane protein translocase component YidC, short form [Caldisalinibacter kiritimatiensis]